MSLSPVNEPPVRIPDVFRDAELQRRFARFGWVVVPALTAADCEELSALWRTHAPADTWEFVASASLPRAERELLDPPVHRIVCERLLDKFVDYRFLLCSFLVRKTGGSFRLAFHQEQTFVDDTAFDGVNLWIPLRDIGPNDGCVRVVSGSHRAGPTPPRGTSHDFFPYDEMLRANPDLVHTITMRAGEALIFANTLVHESLPNTSGSERICVCGIGVPNDAQLLYPYQRGSMQPVELHAATDEFYRDRPFGAAPVGLPKIAEVPVAAPLTIDMMRAAQRDLERP